MKQEPSLVQLSPRGQVTLPSNIRKLLSLHAGDAFRVIVEEGRVVLEPVEITSVELYTEERIREFLQNAEMTDDELERAHRAWGLKPAQSERG